MSRFAVVQLNSVVGDFVGNSQRILSALNQVLAQGVWGQNDWIVFSFGCLGGWPLEELRYNPSFVLQYEQAWKQLSAQFPATEANIVFRHPGLPDPFAPWECGAGDGLVLVELNSRPFEGSVKTRLQSDFIKLSVKKNGWGIFCNSVGAQDACLYSGGSFVCDKTGAIVAQAQLWEPSILLFDTETGQSQEWNASNDVADLVWKELDTKATGETGCKATGEKSGETGRVQSGQPDGEDQRLAHLYSALKLGIRDYVEKNGFRGAIIGLSGGIDSALVAALAVDALGPDRVAGVTMPSQFSSSETRSDADRLAQSLGIEMFALPIAEPFAAFRSQLTNSLAQFDSTIDPQNLTEQNLQARIRGVYLMALSNRSGRVVLNTSNKSEAAVGYGTLYGDLVGGLGVISDVWKTDVWALSRWINRKFGQERIPASIIDRVPSAELREGQQDRDSIPDYPVLDPILQRFVGQGKGIEEIVSEGFDVKDVEKCTLLFNRNEFKRRQCVQGLIVSPCPLSDKKRPMTNKFYR